MDRYIPYKRNQDPPSINISNARIERSTPDFSFGGLGTSIYAITITISIEITDTGFECCHDGIRYRFRSMIDQKTLFDSRY